MTILDSNEMPFPLSERVREEILKKVETTQLNRYPTKNSDLLVNKLAFKLDIKPENLLVGNGSAELLKLTFEAYVKPGETVASIDPSFVMYKFFSSVIHSHHISVDVNRDLTINYQAVRECLLKEKPKLIVLCNPNSPTGESWRREFIDDIFNTTEALVLIDEAYIEFSSQDSLYREAIDKERVVVLRTFSKAYGAAGLRLGYLVASKESCRRIAKVKPPYSVNILSEEIGTILIDYEEDFKRNIGVIREERERVFKALEKYDKVIPSPSDGSFIFFTSSIKTIAERLKEQEILIHTCGPGQYRVSIGLPEENSLFLKALKEVLRAE